MLSIIEPGHRSNYNQDNLTDIGLNIKSPLGSIIGCDDLVDTGIVTDGIFWLNQYDVVQRWQEIWGRYDKLWYR